MPENTGTLRHSMATRDEYLEQPIERRLARLARTADELAMATRGRDDAILSRRPEIKAGQRRRYLAQLARALEDRR